MVLVKMSHEEYIKFCNKIANKYLFGLIVCTIISIFGFAIMIYGKTPLISYVILTIGFGVSVIFLGYNYIHWKCCELIDR